MREWRGRARGARVAELEEVYRSGYRRFLRTATAILGNEDDGADAVHDAFVKAVRHRETFSRRGSLEAWLWRTVVNAAREARAAKVVPGARTAPSGDPAGPPNGAGRFEGELGVAIRALPERQRLVLFLRYCADLEYETIAEVLSVRPGTVAATLHAAHAKLRSHLGEVTRGAG